jgi:hypothetical protein
MRGRDCHSGAPAVQCRQRPTAEERDVSPPDGPKRPVFTTITIDAGSMDGFIMRTGLIAPLQHRILVKGGASVAGASA